MSETSTMEKDYNGDNLSGTQRLFKLYNAPLNLILRGSLENPVEKTRGSVNMIKGENPINRNSIGWDFPVKVLSQVPVKSSIRPTQEIVS